jgi:hypothetical protein
MSLYWPDTPDNVGRSLSGNVFVSPWILFPPHPVFISSWGVFVMPFMLMVDAWRRRIDCRSFYSTIRTIAGSLVEYVYVPFHDSFRYSRSEQHGIHCGEVSPRIIHHSSTMYWTLIHSRYVLPLALVSRLQFLPLSNFQHLFPTSHYHEIPCISSNIACTDVVFQGSSSTNTPVKSASGLGHSLSPHTWAHSFPPLLPTLNPGAHPSGSISLLSDWL